RCLPFRCPLPSLERSELRARGRLWNGTFLEVRDPRGGPGVSPKSRGCRWVSPGCPGMSVALHLDPGVAVTGVPWWVLPLAVLLGLLLLALLVLGLRKLGFFRRARAPPPPAVPRFRAVRIPREQR
ncbi:ITA6 protein, partial [Alaudala cheleensis]|nr:ITA6 protein [Alaudala cheleensis]